MVAMPPAGYAGNESEASVTPSGESAEGLIGIDEVQRALNRSRASVYRYTNTDPRNLNLRLIPGSSILSTEAIKKIR